VSALEAALAGRPVDRPLLAPLFAALAAEVEELDLPTFLADPGRRARIYADLARTLRPDVLVVDIQGGQTPLNAGEAQERLHSVDSTSGGSVPPGVADLLRRVRAVVPEPTALGVVVTGPATLGGPLGAAVQRTLAVARDAAQAGASVVFVDERGTALPDGYARALTPLWGSLKFFRATGVLKADWAGELPRGPFLPCVTTPIEPPYALAVEPGAAPPAGHGATLVTHTHDLAGHVPVRDLQAAVARLSG
jgi:hypothetical protein